MITICSFVSKLYREHLARQAQVVKLMKWDALLVDADLMRSVILSFFPTINFFVYVNVC
jgi:hypothetical protein